MKELISEKLKQIKEAESCVRELIQQYGEQKRIFRDEDIVKIKRNNRRAKVIHARFSTNIFSCDGEVKIEYLVKKLTAGSFGEWVNESDIEAACK